MAPYPKFVLPRSLRARWGKLGVAARRNTIGASRPAEELGQPQDGETAKSQASNAALSTATALSTDTALRMDTGLGKKPVNLGEPEDARLTGGTRSLMRRVLGLNFTSAASVAALNPGARALEPSLRRLPVA